MQTRATQGAKPGPNSPAPERRGEARRGAGSQRKTATAGPKGGRFAAILRESPRGHAAPGRPGQRAPEAEPSGPAERLGREDAAIARVLREIGEGRDGRPRERPDNDAREDLAPFQPPPPALVAPVATAVAQPAAAGSAAAHAEAAALADRLVTSMRVGRVGRDGHEVRMRLALRGDSGLEVRLQVVGERLTAVLAADPGHRDEAHRIAGALERELGARGVSLDEITLE